MANLLRQARFHLSCGSCFVVSDIHDHETPEIRSAAPGRNEKEFNRG
jgi:hypothetical protein